MTKHLHIDKLGLGLVAGLAAGSLIACEEKPALSTGAEPEADFRPAPAQTKPLEASTKSANESSAPRPELDSSPPAGVSLPIEPIVVEPRVEAADAAQTGASAMTSVLPTNKASLVSTRR